MTWDTDRCINCASSVPPDSESLSFCSKACEADMRAYLEEELARDVANEGSEPTPNAALASPRKRRRTVRKKRRRP